MSPLDTSFLHIEDSDRAVSLHIGSIGVFEGPPPAHDVMARTMEQRLSQVSRCRQRVEFVPFGLERPVWVDDDDFSVDYHLRRTALPQPAGPAELRRLVGRLMSQRLDRTKPLWEMWVVEGLADGTWALVSKVHHCMVDGVSGAEILAVLLDLTPDPPDVEAPVWVPEPAPTRRDLVVDAARSLAFDGYEQVRLLGAQVRRPKRAVQQVLDLLPGLVSLGGVAAAPSTGGLTGPISPHREYAWADASLDDVKRVRQQLGGTVNDVVLAAVAGGFRHLLLSRGEDVAADRVVRTLVPVSVRGTRGDGAAAHDGSFDNRISAMFAELPVGVADPVDRLAAITGQLAGLKESGQAVAGEALTALSGFAPPALLALGMRVAARAVRGSGTVHTVTTNVPGPQLPLYSCGRRLLRAYPYVPIAPPLRTGVAIFSYDGAVTFGVTGDREVSRDVDVLAEGIEQALTELLAAADAAADAVPGSVPVEVPPEAHAPTPTVPPPTVPATPETTAAIDSTTTRAPSATSATSKPAPATRPPAKEPAAATKPSTEEPTPTPTAAAERPAPARSSTKEPAPTTSVPEEAAPATATAAEEPAPATSSTRKPAPATAAGKAAEPTKSAAKKTAPAKSPRKAAGPTKSAAKKAAAAKKATAAATRVGAARKTAAATKVGAAEKAAVAKKVGAAEKAAVAKKVGAAEKAAVAKKVGAAKKVSGSRKKASGGGGT